MNAEIPEHKLNELKEMKLSLEKALIDDATFVTLTPWKF